jgi:hypothetical protein
LEQGLIDLRKLTHQNGGGPAIGDDVMKGEQEDVVVGSQGEEAGAEQGRGVEEEGESRLLAGPASSLEFSLREG